MNHITYQLILQVEARIESAHDESSPAWHTLDWAPTLPEVGYLDAKSVFDLAQQMITRREDLEALHLELSDLDADNETPTLTGSYRSDIGPEENTAGKTAEVCAPYHDNGVHYQVEYQVVRNSDWVRFGEPLPESSFTDGSLLEKMAELRRRRPEYNVRAMRYEATRVDA
jgi:hypothetical protein